MNSTRFEELSDYAWVEPLIWCHFCGTYIGPVAKGRRPSASYQQENKSSNTGYATITVSILGPVEYCCARCYFPAKQLSVKKAEAQELRYLIGRVNRLIKQVEERSHEN